MVVIIQFSKLRKLGVNLAVSNDRVFQMPMNYVIFIIKTTKNPTLLKKQKKEGKRRNRGKK